MADEDPTDQAGEEEGGTREEFQIQVVDDKIILNFGQAVHWIGLTPAQARELARILKAKAREARRHAADLTKGNNA